MFTLYKYLFILNASMIYDTGEYMQNFGKVIRKKRREKDMTQKALGKKLGVHEMQIYRWEKSNQKPNYEIFLKIMKILDLKNSDFEEKTNESN